MKLPHGRRFCRYFGSGGAALYFHAMHFHNPAGSGVNAHIFRIMIDSVTVAGGVTEEPYRVVMGPQDTDIVGATYAAATKSMSSYEDGDSSLCEVGGSDGTTPAAEDESTDLPDVQTVSVAMTPDSTVVLDFPELIVVKPGAGWMLKVLGNDNGDIDATFFWVEEPIL